MISNMNPQNLMSQKTMNRSSFTAQITEANRLPEISNEELSNFSLTLNKQQHEIFNEVQVGLE